MAAESDLQKIPEEMRLASLGSFPLSPGVMDGHYGVAHLYWAFRKQILQQRSVAQVFGTKNPEPPELVIPAGHRSISSTTGLNDLVWQYFLKTAFVKRPVVDPREEIRDLIATNAGTDVRNFEARLIGGKTHMAPGINPSLVRAFVFEGKFPYKNDFFQWMIPEMAKEIKAAVKGDFRESWSEGLSALVLLWNAKFPKNSFVPKE